MNSREGVLAGSFEQTFNKGLGKEGIVYADNDIIVVDKPANLQTAPGYIHKDCLARRVADLYDIERVDTMIVHRLDYATSGLVVFARSGAALRALNSQFRGKSKIFKSYIAIVVGQVQQSNGIVDLPIGKDKERGPPYYCIDRKSASARSAETHYSVIEQGATCAMVKLVPVTGR
jgi:tRNA pseudouridine32 synthase/23S rRNA pseudouridine746 synthase